MESEEKCETTTKGSSSPKKNFRYSKLGKDEEDDKLESNLIQKALSMPIDFPKDFDANIDDEISPF